MIHATGQYSPLICNKKRLILFYNIWSLSPYPYVSVMKIGDYRLSC
uniref:Uncharacterized protein n=1 Tax=Anguilla anguilla TaxID=7936 RepID=A0A0E9WFI6_ANGAN